MTSSRLFWTFAIRYGLRNLSRNPRRTGLTVATVALSVAVSIIANRYSTAVMNIWAEGSIDHGTGHAQIHAPGFYAHPDIVSVDSTMPVGQKIESIVHRHRDVLAVSRRLNFEGIISANGKTVYFLGRGVDPAEELLVAPKVFQAGVDAGSFLNSEKPGGIVIGRGLAKALGLKLGDEASILAHTTQGGVNGIDVVVVGIMDPPIPALSKRIVYMATTKAQASIGLGPRYTELVIRLKRGVDPETWTKALAPTILAQGLDLRGWWQVDPVIRKVERIWASVVGVISALLFASAGISVLNMIFLLVQERTIEIGTLMALGARPGQVQALFALEAALLGAFGAFVGMILGNAYVLGMKWLGVPFDSPFSAAKLIIHPEVSALVTLSAIIAATFISWLAALIPSRRASRLNPAVAFRGLTT